MDCYYSLEQAKKLLENSANHDIPISVGWANACREIIRLNEENARLCKQNKLLRRVREYWRNRSDEQVDNYVGLLGEIDKLREKVRWIPVGERFPEKWETILMCDNNHRVEPGVYADPGWLSEGYQVTRIITHWMPLPQPPEEVE